MNTSLYLLDTCTISYFLKSDVNVIKHLQTTDPEQLYISAITVLEIEYGLSIDSGRRLDILRDKWKDFLQLVITLEFKNSTALIAANIKKLLKHQGQMIGAYDILITATAIEHDLICITSNISEFSRVSGLKIQDWRNDSGLHL